MSAKKPTGENRNMTVSNDVYQLIEGLRTEIGDKPLARIVACVDRKPIDKDAPVVVIIQNNAGSKAYIFADKPKKGAKK